jgi:hypothetical protein
MARLDRDRTPALFAVTTSVVSGVILAVLTKSLQAGISTGTTLIWSALVSAVVATAFWAAFAVRSRKRSGAAFLMTSAFNQKYYVAAFVQQVHSALDRDDIDLVLKVPDRDYDAGAQAHHLRRILSKKHHYLGGIVIASEVARLREDLTAFCRESRLPVVFSDLEPFPTESEYPGNTAFIGYDTGELGELAGQWLVRRLRGRTARGCSSSPAGNTKAGNNAAKRRCGARCPTSTSSPKTIATSCVHGPTARCGPTSGSSDPASRSTRSSAPTTRWHWAPSTPSRRPGRRPPAPPSWSGSTVCWRPGR